MSILQARISRIFMVVAALCCLTLTAGCQESIEQKKGAVGEFCNGNDRGDCRENLVCDDRVCMPLNRAAIDVCQDVCEKFESCNSAMDGCQADCTTTVETWGVEPTEQFGNCIAEDLTCAEIRQSDNPPQICYQRLPLDETKDERCKELERVGSLCLENRSMDPLLKACRKKARTARQADWEATAECETAADNAQCGALFSCVNEKLPLAEEDTYPTRNPNE